MIMKKRPSTVIPPTAFSIASQFTGPPFSVTLESADLRRHLLEEMVQPASGKTAKTRARNSTPAQPALAGKAPAKHLNQKPKKQAQPGSQ